MRNFDEEARHREQYAPGQSEEDRTFILGGERLVRVRRVPGWILMEMAEAFGSESEIKAAHAIATGMRALIVPEYRDAYDRALRATGEDGEALVSFEQLQEVFMWAFGGVANRPPTQPSVSASQPNGTTNGLTGLSPTEASPSLPSTGINS